MTLTHPNNGTTATGVHGTHAGHTHHGAFDGAAAGGIAGHQGHHGHTGRDAAVGGVAGHLAENHHERHLRDVNNQTHHAGGGTHTVTTTSTITKPTVGDKIAGSVDVAVGKLTHNPNQVAVGEIRKTEGKAATAGVSGNAAAGTAGRGGAY